MEQENSMESAKSRILEASLGHAAFDGWSEVTLKAALDDSAVAPALGRALFPRGGIDLAVAYHLQGDRAMREALAAPETVNGMAMMGLVAQSSSPAELAARLKADTDLWGPLVKTIGFSADA